METDSVISLKVKGLDSLLGSIKPPYLLAVAGHPGAGKTTLALTICCRNALEGKKCLYVSFYEDREKLFSYMSKLGLDLARAESSGYLKYLKLPATSDIDTVVEAISTYIAEGQYKIVVVDSINVLLDGVREDIEKRAWLLNFFYNIPTLTNGLGILVVELPYGSERIEVGGLEFVVDAMLLLKHRTEGGFLVRTVEIRKTRGAPITVVEVPFSISEGRGIEVWPPPVIEYVSEERGEIRLPCEVLRRTWSHLYQGHVVNLVQPPDSEYRDILVLILAMALENDMKVLLISYKYSPRVIYEAVEYRLRTAGIDQDAVEAVKSKYLKIFSLNPFSESFSQLIIRENTLVDAEDPDIVVFHGVELPRTTVSSRRHIKELYNQVNYFKQRGLLVVRISSYVDRETYSLESKISDALMRFYYDRSSGVNVKYKAFVYRKNAEPVFLSHDEIEKCAEECLDAIRRFSQRIKSKTV